MTNYRALKVLSIFSALFTTIPIVHARDLSSSFERIFGLIVSAINGLGYLAPSQMRALISDGVEYPGIWLVFMFIILIGIIHTALSSDSIKFLKGSSAKMIVSFSISYLTILSFGAEIVAFFEGFTLFLVILLVIGLIVLIYKYGASMFSHAYSSHHGAAMNMENAFNKRYSEERVANNISSKNLKNDLKVAKDNLEIEKKVSSKIAENMKAALDENKSLITNMGKLVDFLKKASKLNPENPKHKELIRKNLDYDVAKTLETNLKKMLSKFEVYKNDSIDLIKSGNAFHDLSTKLTKDISKLKNLLNSTDLASIDQISNRITAYKKEIDRIDIFFKNHLDKNYTSLNTLSSSVKVLSQFWKNEDLTNCLDISQKIAIEASFFSKNSLSASAAIKELNTVNMDFEKDLQALKAISKILSEESERILKEKQKEEQKKNLLSILKNKCTFFNLKDFETELEGFDTVLDFIKFLPHITDADYSMHKIDGFGAWLNSNFAQENIGWLIEIVLGSNTGKEAFVKAKKILSSFGF